MNGRFLVIVRRIVLDEVKVPARADSINSPEVDYCASQAAGRWQQGWTQQFDQVPKTMIQVEFDNGIIGLGESYRGIPRELMRAVAKELIGTDLRKLNLQALPTSGWTCLRRLRVRADGCAAKCARHPSVSAAWR